MSRFRDRFRPRFRDRFRDRFRASGGSTALTSWANLPSSPSDGDQVSYEDSSGSQVTLEYDGANAQWEMIDTGGDWVTIDDFSDGTIDTDLWDVTDGASRFTEQNGRLEFDVVAGQSDFAFLTPLHPMVVKSETSIAFDMNFNGLTRSSSGFTLISLRQRDIDGDGDGTPLSRSSVFNGGQVDFQHKYQDEGGSFQTNDPAEAMDVNTTYRLENRLTDDGANLTATVEVFDGAASQAGNSEVFSASYLNDVIGATRLWLENSAIDTNGTIWIDEVQVKIG